jgi:hypothetical protein
MIFAAVVVLAAFQSGANPTMAGLQPLADCWNETFAPLKAVRTTPERMQTALSRSCRDERRAFVMESVQYLMSLPDHPAYADVDREVNRHVDSMIGDMISKYTIWYETGRWPN